MTHDSHDLLMADWLDGGRGLVFTQFARDSTFLVTSTRDASGSWGPPVRLPLRGAQATRPRVSRDGPYVAFLQTSGIDSAASA